MKLPDCGRTKSGCQNGNGAAMSSIPIAPLSGQTLAPPPVQGPPIQRSPGAPASGASVIKDWASI